MVRDRLSLVSLHRYPSLQNSRKLLGLDSCASNSHSKIVLTRSKIDAGGRESCMTQDSLHLRKLCAFVEHAFRQAVAQHMWRNHIKLLSKCPQAFGSLQVPLSLRRLAQLGCCLPTQIRNALPDHTGFDPWNERTRSIGKRRVTMQLIGTVSIAAKSSCVNSLSAPLHDCRNPGRRQDGPPGA